MAKGFFTTNRIQVVTSVPLDHCPSGFVESLLVVARIVVIQSY